MKEYKIQMRYQNRHNGKWVGACYPDGTYCSTYGDHKTAESTMEYLREKWPIHVENWNKDVPKDLEAECPIDFRILFREVTEWEPEND